MSWVPHTRRARGRRCSSTRTSQCEALGDPRTARHAPADDHAVFASSSRLARCALLPPELLCAQFVALGNVARGERDVEALVALRARCANATRRDPFSKASASSSRADSVAKSPGTAPGPRIEVGAPTLRFASPLRDAQIRRAVKVGRGFRSSFRRSRRACWCDWCSRAAAR